MSKIFDFVKPGVITGDDVQKVFQVAKENNFALPAVNCVGTDSINAVLETAAKVKAPVIVQFSNGGASFIAGKGVKSDVPQGAAILGAISGAHHVHQMAEHYGVPVILHTDHCAKQYLDEWVRPLLAHEADQVARGQEPTFQSHMWDGSTVPLKENLDIAEELLDKSQKAHTVLEIEIGAVGGEEDGHSAEINDKLYSTPAQGIAVAQRLGLGERGRYMAAFTFGNVHGAYKPGVVKLRPELLDEIQTTVALAIKAGEMPDPAHSLDVAPGKPFALVFHGGSGSAPEEIAQAVSYGVVKMNIDTDTQYAFSRAVAGHMFSNYDSVLKIDGEVGNKKMYDPRSWGREAESAMAARVVEACRQLGSAGKALK